MDIKIPEMPTRFEHMYNNRMSLQDEALRAIMNDIWYAAYKKGYGDAIDCALQICEKHEKC